MENILVIDVGTSSLKAMLYNCGGALLFHAQQEYHSEFGHNNYVEQKPLSWQEALIVTLKNAAKFVNDHGITPAAIAVTSQRASVIPVNSNGEPLYNALMWQDKRSIDQCKKISSELTLTAINRKTGLRLDPYFSAPKMMWLKNERPEIYANTHKLIGVQDYIIFLLTGNFVTDWTQACRTMLMNINTFSWDDDMLRVTGISPALLPELCPPGTVAGKLSPALSTATGLASGIPVIIGGGDQQCAALALNVLQPGYAEANTGTGSFVIAYSESPQFDANCRTLCSAAAVAGKWIVEAGIFTTGLIHRWFREQFYPPDDAAYELMNAEAAMSPVGANGVMLLPHFEGSAAPYWNPVAKGMFFNLTMATKRCDFTRAILEGISLEVAHNLSLIENLSGPINKVSVAGGLTTLELFNRIQTDTFNKMVLRYDNNEASSLGAMISATVTLGIYKTHSEAFSQVTTDPMVFEPDAGNAKKYAYLFERKDCLYNALNHNQIYTLFWDVI